jgi:hypothetical protein
MKEFAINKILPFLFALAILYCVFTILRSIGILYIVYTDDYFYHLDFKLASFREKQYIFLNAYYFFPYIVGVLISLSMKKMFNLKWAYFLFAIIGVLVLFRQIDSYCIRPLFGIFQNPKMNVVSHLLVFLMLFVGLVLKNRLNNQLSFKK